MEKQEVIISQHIASCLTEAIGHCPHDRLFVLTDTTTLDLCWPLIKNLPCLDGARMITIGATEIGRASCRERCRSRWSPYH